MPSTSNVGRVCPKCFVGTNLAIHSCGTESEVIDLGTRINLPKHNNKRAWKRILSGEKRWNRRKSRGKRGVDTYIVYEYREEGEPIPRGCDCECCNMFPPQYRMVRVPGSGRECINMRRKPDVDLGG